MLTGNRDLIKLARAVKVCILQILALNMYRKKRTDLSHAASDLSGACCCPLRPRIRRHGLHSRLHQGVDICYCLRCVYTNVRQVCCTNLELSIADFVAVVAVRLNGSLVVSNGSAVKWVAEHNDPLQIEVSNSISIGDGIRRGA